MVPTKIKVDDFLIRKLKKSDASSLYKNVKDKEIVRYTLNIPHPYQKKDAAEFIGRSIKEWNEGKSYVFGIEIDKEIVGICSINNIDKESRHGTLGYWLGKKYWGQKFMSKAAKAVVDFGFKELKLHRIEVTHFAENIASQKIIQKLGFKLEGKEREKIFRFGRWHDHLLYGLLEQDFSKFSGKSYEILK